MGSLGTVLEKLTSFFSQYFLIASYFPVLIFLAANAICIYLLNLEFRTWLGKDTVQTGVTGIEILLAAAVLAYALSTATSWLRDALENLPIVPSTFRNSFRSSQAQRRGALLVRLETHMRERREVTASLKAWRQTLTKAREDGASKRRNSYAHTPRELDHVVDAATLQTLDADDVERAVTALAAELKANNVNDRIPGTTTPTPAAAKLDGDHVRLNAAMNALRGQLEYRAVRVFNEIQFNFARTGEVAPTRMGNIGLSVQYYFSSRYQLNFNFFWTRVQKALEGETSFAGVLKLAKAQLEFHVTMFWLSCLFGLLWIPASAWYGYSFAFFLSCAVATPLAAWLSYELAVQSYRSYADLLRTAGDLYHFKLMESLHLPLPPTTGDEREMWKQVGQWLDQGDYFDLPYKHPASTS